MDAEALGMCNATDMAVIPRAATAGGVAPGVKAEGSVTPGVTEGVGPNAASALWNAMVKPFLRTSIFGAIWYRG